MSSRTNSTTYDYSPTSGNSIGKNSATDDNLAFWGLDDARYTKDQRKTLKEYEKKYAGKVYKDNFLGQSQANYALGRMTQDLNAAYSDYWEDKSDENWMYAQTLENYYQEFLKNNAAALDNEGVVLPWLSQSAAGYLPQLEDQTVASLGGIATGAAVGAGVGSVVPGLGTGIGAMWGGRAGYVTARGLHSWEQMRGAAFRQLLANGVDYETAQKAAEDESIVAALIESGDAVVDLLTLGGGKLLTTLGKGGLKAVGNEVAESGVKRLLKGTGQYGLNIAGEWVEEAAQEGVSIANQNRTSTGVLDLIGETTSTLWDAATGQNDDAWNRIVDAGNDGAKIAVMFGGATKVGNSAVQSGLNYAGNVLNTISPQTSYSSGMPLAQKNNNSDRNVAHQESIAFQKDFRDMPLAEENNRNDRNMTSQEYRASLKSVQESDFENHIKDSDGIESETRYSDIVNSEKSAIMRRNSKPLKFREFERGRAVNDFFYYDGDEHSPEARRNSRHTQWSKSLSADQKNAISDYMGIGYRDLNRYLKKSLGWETIDGAKVKAMMKSIDSALECYVLKDNIRVQRGVTISTIDRLAEQYDVKNSLSELIGKKFVEDGYSSTTALRNNKVATAKPVVLDIEIPAGVGRGAYINEFGGNYRDAEYEFLIKRGASFTITEVIEDIYSEKFYIRMVMDVD